jgi:hypothetical protein
MGEATNVKRPSFQFYPADWRNDAGLRMCSMAARGLWVEMLCVMHTCERYGHLQVGGKSVSSRDLSRMIGADVKSVNRLLSELEQHTVFSRDENGIIYSRRMVSDEVGRGKWRDRQAKSRDCHAEVTEQVTAIVTPKSRPSSSSSSSSSPSSKEEHSLRSCSEPEPEIPNFLLRKKPQKRRMPDDFEPKRNLATTYWMKKARPDLARDVEDQVTQFKAHHRKCGSQMEDWDSAWVTWYSKAPEMTRPQTVEHTNGSLSLAELIATKERAEKQGIRTDKLDKAIAEKRAAA